MCHKLHKELQDANGNYPTIDVDKEVREEIGTAFAKAWDADFADIELRVLAAARIEAEDFENGNTPDPSLITYGHD